jgi:hypothetical protein
MRFCDLVLYDAIYEARQEIQDPGSSKWEAVESHNDTMVRCVYKHLKLADIPRFTAEQITKAWGDWRRQKVEQDTPEEKFKCELIVEVARSFGNSCFMRGRVATSNGCAEELHLDRIIPGSKGGRYVLENCMLTCTTHNVSRGDRSIEEYLRSPRTCNDRRT